MAAQGGDSDNDSEPEALQYKVILLGDGTVGKTSVANRFTDDVFGREYKQTIGLDFFIKRIVLPGDVHVALQIWDIGGQTIGSKMISNYIFGAHAVVLIYDITNFQSFQDLEDWLGLVQKVNAEGTMPYVALMGNKTDLGHLRVVKPDKHNKFAEDNSMFTYFVSAKTGDNVNTAFYRVAADLAGVGLSRPDLEVATRVVKAEIVDHPTTSPPGAAAGTAPQEGDKPEEVGGKKKCVVQ